MRTYPMAYDKVDMTGRAPIYVTLGAGGNREGHSKGYRNPFAKEAWVATRTLEDFGYGHLYAPNATHARFQWVRDRTSNNNYEDIAWIFNPHAKL
jgi:Iron/zinc purple acid phosphatase-like protein C